jgi:hypothetical protein
MTVKIDLPHDNSYEIFIDELKALALIEKL